LSQTRATRAHVVRAAPIALTMDTFEVKEMMKMAFVHGKTDQRGFFEVGLGLALFAVFAATGWGLVTLVDEPPQTAAGPEIPAASATSEPAGGASAQ